MARNRTITSKITLDGEKEYKKQLSDLNAALKQNQAEMQKLSAEYEGNENSVEALTAKGELLNKQLEIEKERAQANADMLEKAKAARDEHTDAVEKAREELERQTKALEQLQDSENASSEAIEKQRAAVTAAEGALREQEQALENANKAVQQYELNLTKSETSVQRASNAIDQNTDAVKANEKGSKSLSDVLSSLADTIGIKLPEGAQKATEGINAGAASTAAWAAAAGMMISQLISASKETAKMADDINALSVKTGVSTDTLQAWNYASSLMDVEVSTVTGSMTKLTRAMADAQTGSEKTVSAFRRLNVVYKDANGQLRDSEDVWWDAVEALGRIKNEAERDAVAMDLFGRNAKELNTVIDAGRDGFEGFRKEAEQMGYIMDQAALDKFNKLADEMDKFDAVQQTVKQNLGTALLPILTALFELLAKIDPKIIQTVAIAATIVATIVTVVKAIKSVTGAMGTIGTALGSMNPAMLKTTAIIIGVVAALIALATIIAVIAGKSRDLQQSMAAVGSSVASVQSQVSGAQNNVPRYATGTDFHPGGWAIVGERGREAVWLPRGARVLTNEQTERAMSGAPRYADGIGFGGGVVINEVNEFKVDSLEDYLAIKEWHRKRQLSRRKGYAPV